MYPPKHHLNKDLDKIYQVIKAYPFATLISHSQNDILVTQLPLMLDTTSNEKAVLLGHIDKNNPQSKHLNAQKIKVLFTGPDCYISPTVYASSQLPTWNYISVDIEGFANVMTSKDTVLDSIEKMTQFLEHDNSAYQFNRKEKRVQSLIDFIVGFEITIVNIIGRFKLSQDKSEQDKLLAKDKLIQRSSHSHAELINSILK